MTWMPWVLLIAGLALLFFGGEFLVKGSGALAVRLGLSPLVAGLTVVAFGTSSPELIVSLKAALDGLGAIALGNVVGSNIFNIAFILGLTALICPLRPQLQVIRVDTPIMVVVTLIGMGVAWDFQIGRVEGAIFVALLVAYVAATVWMARRTPHGPGVDQEFEESVPRPSGAAWKDVAFIVGGLVLLVAGSRLLVSGAVDIARGFGVSEAVIGLTIVAAGTSAPELAASLVAAFRRQPDIALGNIVGSNVFNILGILGISSLVSPIAAAGLSHVDYWVMLAFAAVLVPIIWTNRRLERWEGAVLLAGYGAYLWHLWPKG